MSDVVNEHHTQIYWVPTGSTPPDSEVIDETCRNGGAYAFKQSTLVRLPVVQKKPMMTRRMAGQLEADKEHNVMTTGVEESAEDEVIAGKVYNVLRTMTDTHQVKHTHSGTFQNQCHYATGAKVQLTGSRGAFFNVLRATNRDWSSGTARR